MDNPSHDTDKHLMAYALPLCSQPNSLFMCARLLQEEAESQAVESGVETILGIFDLKAFNSSNADFGFAKFLVSACLCLVA